MNLTKPRILISLIVVMGTTMVLVLLLHFIGSALLAEKDQLEGSQLGHVHHRKYHDSARHIKKALNVGSHSNRIYNDATSPVSLSPDIDARSKFQKAQVLKYCEKFGMPDALPDDYFIVDEVLQSLLLDREHKLVYCVAPKLASSNTKLLFAALNKVISPERATQKYSPKLDLQAYRYRLSSESKADRDRILVSYFKFVTTRNPLERILSAYCNKFENHPIDANVTGRFDPTKIEVIKKYRPEVYSRWEKSGRTIKVFPTFNEFIRYLDSHSYYELDIHFRPLQYICHPCVFQYDFYANLKLMPGEFDRLFEKFNIPQNSFRNQPAAHDTGSLMPKYFTKLSEAEKKMVYRFVHQELEFYYHIYPEERDMHIPLIGNF